MTAREPMTNPLENNDYPLRSLFEGYVFQIPDYQRFYSWEHSHYDDLWNDLLNIVDERSRNHYMGTVICKDEQQGIISEEFNENYRLYSIVDGQQRFTTLIILAKAIFDAYSKIEKTTLSDKAQERYRKLPVDQAKKRFIQDSSLIGENDGFEIQNKLKLQQDDNNIFKAILRNEVDTVKINTPSEQRLVDAYRFFCKQLVQQKHELNDGEFVDLVGNLLRSIHSLQFMVYTIESNEEATLIFESINDRGKALSNLDKTKSFLMHKIYLTEVEPGQTAVGLDEVQQRFGEIYSRLQTIENKPRTQDLDEDQIQQYHYIAEIPRSINRTYLSLETDRQRTLRAGAPVYLDALKWHFNQLYEGNGLDPYTDYPRDCSDEIDWYTRGLRRYYAHVAGIATYDEHGKVAWELAKIFSLGRVGNFYPLLLSIWDDHVTNGLPIDNLHRILETLEIAAFRIYAVANKRADTGQSKLYRLANKYTRDKITLGDIKSELESAIDRYEDDLGDSLRDSNLYSTMSNRDLRYLLYSYELHVRNEEKLGDPPAIEKVVQNANNNYSVDHIWPQNTDKLELSEEEKERHEELKDSLGNLTLTPGPRNASWKNLPFEVKKDRRSPDDEGQSKPDYITSDFAMTKRLAAEHQTWNAGNIEQRRENIIEFAKDRWSLDPDRRRAAGQIMLTEYTE